jgi:uncharacterized protein YxjI
MMPASQPSDQSPVALARQVESVSVANQSRYRIRRSFWSLFDRKFYVETLDGQPVLFVKHPVFRLREEFRICTDETEQTPVFILKSRQILAINFNFDITDANTGALVATIQKKGLRSLIRDKFHILDVNGQEVGTMEEQGASLLRRFFPILTSKHELMIKGQRAAYVTQLFRFFNKEFEVDVTPGLADQRFVLSCALLAVIAESRREQGG